MQILVLVNVEFLVIPVSLVNLVFLVIMLISVKLDDDSGQSDDSE